MIITNLAFKYPTRVVLFFSIIVLLGAMLIPKLSLQNLPSISIPNFTISIEDKGLAAEDVYTLITHPVEKWFENMEGVNEIVGSSHDSYSLVWLGFEMGVNANQAYENIQKRINNYQSSLPKNATNLVLSQQSVTGTPIMWAIVQSDKLSPQALSRFVSKNLQNELENLPGVGGLDIVGKVPHNIKVALDQEKMSALGIPLALVYEAFQNENVLLPGLSVQNDDREYILLLDLQLKSIETIKSLIISYRDKKPIYLSEIADVFIQTKPENQIALFHDKPAIAIGVLRTPDANEIDVINTVETKLEKIKSQFSDVMIETKFSDKKSIENSANSLLSAMAYGFAFSILIIFLFLGSMRLSLVVMIIIPVSLMAAIISMNWFNLTANVLTLSSLIILINIVVDDAIIVIENYVYDLMNTPTPTDMPRAVYSTNRISHAIIAYTICLSIIFLSAVFSDGLIKIFFTNISAVIVPGVLTSALASITLIPLVCQKFIQKKVHPIRISQRLISKMSQFEDYYVICVKYILQRPGLYLTLFLLLLVPLPFVVSHMNQNLFPGNTNYDRLNITIRTVTNVPNDQFHNDVVEGIKIINAHPDVVDTLAITHELTPNEADITVLLKSAQDRTSTAGEIANQLQKKLDLLPGFLSFVNPPPIYSGAPPPLDFKILGQQYSQLWALQDRLMAVFEKHPNLGKIFSVGTALHPAYKLTVNRLASAQAGLNTKEIAQAVALYGGKIDAGKTILSLDNQEYQIYLFPKAGSLITPHDLSKIYLYNDKGQAINLTSVAKIQLVTRPLLAQSYNNSPSIEFYSTPKIALSKAKTELSAIMKKELKNGEVFSLGGQAQKLDKYINTLIMAIAIAILLLYIALLIQFNSISLPFILLISQPIAIALVIYMLAIVNIGLNLFSLMGLFLLIGIKTKNYILLITSMNRFFDISNDSKIAALEACKERFRPIIMTSIVVLLTMIPTLFTKGVVHAQNVSMSGTIMLGIVTSTFFSLFFVPIAYAIFRPHK